jgi:hypothetical protein
MLLISGCDEYRIIKPENPPIVQAEASPLPLVIGLRNAYQPAMGSYDLVSSFVRRFTELNLFKAVFYPIRSDDKLDLTMDLTFKYSFEYDKGGQMKSFITGLFLYLPVLFLEYENHYKLSATLLISRGAQPIKTYQASTDIRVVTNLKPPWDKINKESIPALINDLVDQLVSQVQKDKVVYGGLQ